MCQGRSEPLEIRRGEAWLNEDPPVSAKVMPKDWSLLGLLGVSRIGRKTVD